LGATTSPNQASYYDYDLLDNLVHITRARRIDTSSTIRFHVWIRENQSEQATNSSYDLSDYWNTAATGRARFSTIRAVW